MALKLAGTNILEVDEGAIIRTPVVSLSTEVSTIIKSKPNIAPLMNLPLDVAREVVAKSRERVNEVADGLDDILRKRAGRAFGMLPKASSLVTPVGKAGSKGIKRFVKSGPETGFYPPGLVGATGRGKKRGFLFSPFTLRIWDKKTGGLFGRGTKSGGLKDATIPVGLYQFNFKIPKVAVIPFIETTRHIPIKIKGKRAVIRMARIDNAEGTLKVQLDVQQNPLPIIAAVLAIGAALGVGGWGVSEALESVDKVVVDTANNAWKIALTGLGVFIGLKVFKVI